MRLNNKVAIITGAASGFGEGIAIKFASEGAKVVIADINISKANEVAKKIGENAVSFKIDVSEPLDTKNLINFTLETYKKLDILVQNAAVGMKPQLLVDTPLDLFDKLFKINVRSVYLGAVYAVPVFRKQGFGGVIINTISTAAKRPRPGLTAYNATKGALVTMTKGQLLS